jgi:hypothetical protein
MTHAATDSARRGPAGTGLRGRVVVLLLAGFAAAGVLAVVGSLLLALTVSGLGWVGDLLADGLTLVAVAAVVLAVLPGVALVLFVRGGMAGSVTATLYGALVVALTATQAREDSLLLVAHLAGLALVVCAFPLGEPVDSAA